MSYLYCDFETEVGKNLSLSCMTTRQYLTATRITAVAYALNNDPVECALAGESGFQPALDLIKQYIDQGATVVAHNASFDVRVLTIKLGIIWPAKVHCTMEMAQGWSPNQPGGYGLANLSRIWTPQFVKGQIDFETCTPDQLRAYNAQDVEACRALHQIALARMHPDEIRVMELTQNIKELVFSVDQSKIATAVQSFDALIAQHGADARAILGESESFGEEGGQIKSVKPHALRQALLEHLGFEASSISLKKLNPEKLRQNPNAAAVLESSAQVNKSLSHKRRVRSFAGATSIDCELTYFSAHTGRWSSRNGGKGLNLHNCVSVSIPLLTDRGWISILSLTPEDKVWDGTEFVQHHGVRLSPLRPLEPTLAACRVTRDHPVWDGKRMRARGVLCPAQRAASSAAGLCSLLRAAAKLGSMPGVMDAVLCALGQSQGYLRAAAADLAPTMRGMSTTGGGLIAPGSDLFDGGTTICSTATALAGMESFDTWETKWCLDGVTSAPSFAEYESILGGMIQACTWIGSTVANRTDPATSGSCQRWLTRAIVAIQSALPREKSLRITPHGLASSISAPTTNGGRDALYDVLGVGPRARYQAGGLIVSNCPKRNPAIAKPFRSLFRVPDDLCLVRGDFANVEYRVTGLLTDCAHVRSLFTANPLADPYAEFWTAATGQKVDKTVKADVPKRQLAKAAVLGLGYCLAEDTPVLTDHGWKAIQTITKADKLWDGTGWIQHGGVVNNGRKPVIQLNGIWLTAQHRVLSRSGWVEAGAIAGNELTRIPAWGSALGDGRLLVKSTTLDPNAGLAPGAPAVIAEVYGPTGSYAVSRWSAVCARVRTVGEPAASPGSIPASYPTLAYAADGSLRGIISSSGASLVQTPTTGSTMEGGASRFVSRIAEPFSDTSPLYQDGTTGGSTSTVATWTGITNPAICGWSTHQNPSETSANVYDILDAGPHSRFQAGLLLVHNCMGQQRWTDELLRSISDPTFKVTLADLEAVCGANGWVCPSDQRTRAIISKLRCPGAVASVAYYTREKFHQVHPEFGRAARAIEQTGVRAMSLGFDPQQAQRALDQLKLHGVRLLDDRTLQGQTIRAICGYWPTPTVAWRDLMIRQTPTGTGPTFVRAGSKPVAKFSINIGIENLIQSAARNALCLGLLELDRRGYPYVLHVHDEIMIVTERTCQAVTAARQTLLDVFGPGGWLSQQGWEWAVLINPKETTLSQSLWDDEALAQTLWPRIAAGDATALENLP